MSSLLNETEFSSEASNQHIKDIKLQVEYRYLAKNAPGGVFIMPEFNDIRKYHGVIFVKKGLYRDGIFRFTLVLPKEYNDVNTYPEITFTPPIFNPFIDPMTGILDLKQDPDKATWQPDKHYIRDALYFLKRSFYMKDFSVFENVANEEARKLFKDDKECYAELVSKCVKESCLRMLDEPEGNMIHFYAFYHYNHHYHYRS